MGAADTTRPAPLELLHDIGRNGERWAAVGPEAGDVCAAGDRVAEAAQRLSGGWRFWYIEAQILGAAAVALSFRRTRNLERDHPFLVATDVVALGAHHSVSAAPPIIRDLRT